MSIDREKLLRATIIELEEQKNKLLQHIEVAKRERREISEAVSGLQFQKKELGLDLMRGDETFDEKMVNLRKEYGTKSVRVKVLDKNITNLEQEETDIKISLNSRAKLTQKSKENSKQAGDEEEAAKKQMVAEKVKLKVMQDDLEKVKAEKIEFDKDLTKRRATIKQEEKELERKGKASAQAHADLLVFESRIKRQMHKVFEGKVAFKSPVADNLI